MQRMKNSLAKAVGVAVIGAAFTMLGAGAAQAETAVGVVNAGSEEGGQQVTTAVPGRVPGPSIMVAGIPLTPAAAFGMLNR